jgi:uncharacterized membrane protein YccC
VTDDETDVAATVRELQHHLDATEELPVRPAASPWLGEAAALASDLADADLPAAVVAERVRRVRDLLDSIETTGNETADDHVAAAETAAARVLEAVETTG